MQIKKLSAVAAASAALLVLGACGGSSETGDTGSGPDTAKADAAQEAVELTKVGFTNTEVLTAATWGAREWLGRPGLEEGADADLLVLPRDPR